MSWKISLLTGSGYAAIGYAGIMTHHDDHGHPGTRAHETIVDATMGLNRELAPNLSGYASDLGHDAIEAIAALPSGSALLIVRRGPNIGARFLLDSDSAVAGRHPEADIFLDDVTVSRRHAEFVRVGTAFEVRDLGSLNGTYVDGQSTDAAPLREGTEVQVGRYRLTFYASRRDFGLAAQ